MDGRGHGQKRWASYERVCEGVATGELGTGYLDDPSEGFAQSYALLHYREATFGYTPSSPPTPAASTRSRRTSARPGRARSAGP